LYQRAKSNVSFDGQNLGKGIKMIHVSLSRKEISTYMTAPERLDGQGVGPLFNQSLRCQIKLILDRKKCYKGAV
jgi:hypothetical protein